MFKKIKKMLRNDKKVSSNSEDWNQVKEKWSKIIKKDQKHLEAWIQLISADINLSEYDQAVKSSIQAQDIFPENKLFIVLEARAQLGNKNFMKAKELYDALILLDEHKTEAHLQLSLIHILEEKYEEAITYASKVKDENQAKLYTARAYMKLNEKDSAIPYWRELYENNHNLQEASVQLASIYISKSMLDDSLLILNNATKKFNKNIVLLNLKAKTHELRGEYHESINTYKDIISKNKNKENAYIKIAKIFLLQENISDAKHYTNLALTINKDNIEAMVLDARITKKMI